MFCSSVSTKFLEQVAAMKTMRIAFACILGGFFCTPRWCEGFIAYTWLDRGMYTAGEPISYDLDFNADSISDILFMSTGMWFDAIVQGDNQVIAGGNNVHALAEGTSIGPDTPQEDWLQGYLGHLGINSCAVLPPPFGVVCSGEFIQTTAYMGVMFNIEDAIHYGWVRISNPFYGASGGIIMDFAYETEAGVGILAGAGAIPEPATATLILAGCILLTFRRKKT
jgi:hypothetical protein